MEEPLMSRLARLPSIPFGWYYITLHSVTNRKIVTSESELRIILRLLRTTLRERGARLHAGYIGECEVHLALQAGEGRLSAITGRFQHEYARLFNRTHVEHGSLFRLHHRVLLFQHQQLLVPLVHFIHWIRRLESPNGCQRGLWWSSDGAYRGNKKLDWVTTNVVLRMLTRGAYSREIQEEAYRNFFDQPPAPSYARLFKNGSAKDPRLLGDARFIADVCRQIGRQLPHQSRDRALEGDIPGVVTQIVGQFKALCDQRLPKRTAIVWKNTVTYDNVRLRSRKRPLPMVRALSVSYLIKHKIATATQTARFFRCSTRSLSADRRNMYETLFHDCFDANPEILFCPLLRHTKHLHADPP
jgi:hypothetical protein